ncbi:enoyl-CoA hydratase-related protein [Fusobacterium necrophorum]|uniref:enoyl-CoA hydratase-related protein n=1 Tax=Fusobacterium necrophorum TaxID=859 RepID=UPI003D9A7E00
MSMHYENLIFEVKDSIAFIRMNRPKALNALSKELLEELSCAISEVETNSDIKAVIITGEGKAFVAGADISLMRDYNSEQGREYCKFAVSIFNRIENLGKPVIAAVNGYALGGGCELAMSCDIRIASEKAQFGQPEVNLGIIPYFGGTQRLSRLVGSGIAKELIFTADFISASEAYRIGLANKVVAAETLLEEAEKMMRKIMTKGPIAIQYAKVAINQGINMSLADALELETSVGALCFATEDKKEGMGAFLEKREAKFSGK